MLSLQLKSGEYLSIGDNIVVQIFEQSGSSFRVSIKAPREIPILRGEVLERTEERPGGLFDKRPKSPSERARDAKRIQTIEEKRERAETARKQREALQSAVTSELLAILGEMDAMTQKSGTAWARTQELHARLAAVGAVLSADK